MHGIAECIQAFERLVASRVLGFLGSFEVGHRHINHSRLLHGLAGCRSRQTLFCLLFVVMFPCCLDAVSLWAMRKSVFISSLISGSVRSVAPDRTSAGARRRMNVRLFSHQITTGKASHSPLFLLSLATKFLTCGAPHFCPGSKKWTHRVLTCGLIHLPLLRHCNHPGRGRGSQAGLTSVEIKRACSDQERARVYGGRRCAKAWVGKGSCTRA